MAQIVKKETLYTTPSYGEYFDDNGYALTKENTKNTYAKTVDSNGLVSYYILLADKNNVYNPYSIYTNNSTNKFLFSIQDRCFKKVSKSIFDMYVKFLNSQNLALLYNVQRKVLI